MRILACGIASLMNAFDPEVVILGGGMTESGETLFKPLREELMKVTWQPTNEAVPVVPVTLGPWAGAIGAARFAMQLAITERPPVRRPDVSRLWSVTALPAAQARIMRHMPLEKGISDERHRF